MNPSRAVDRRFSHFCFFSSKHLVIYVVVTILVFTTRKIVPEDGPETTRARMSGRFG